MIRTSALLGVLFCVYAVVLSTGTNSVDATNECASSDLDSTPEGVEAEYSICYSIPWTRQSGVMHVKYLVTAEEWAAVVGADVGFIHSAFGPPIATCLIHSHGDRVEFHSPWQGERAESLRGIQRNRREANYDTQSYRPVEIIDKLDETLAWRIPVDIEPELLEAKDLNEDRRNYENPSPLDVTSELICRRSNGQLDGLTQILSSDWKRTHSEFRKLEDQFCAQVCEMQDHNSRFATFFEWRPEIPGTHPRHLETGLQFHNGGRRVEIDWHADLGCAVPVAIRVSLGNRPGGMFLRSCKLVRSRKVSAEDVRNEIQKAKNRTLADLTLINVGVQLSQHFWMQSPNDLDESHRKIALQFHAAYQQILKSPELSIGNEVSALRDLVILTAASDESPDLKQFRDAVRTYSRKIGETSGITGVATMMFDLLDMLRVWKREDLVDLVHAEFRTSLEQEKLEQQFSTLLSIAGPDEAREFSTECFLNVIGRIARCPELSEPDRLRIRAGLIVASYRLEHSLIEELAPANNAHIADAERRKQRRDQLTREYVDVLKLVEASEDDVLKDTAQVLQKKFAAMDFNEP